MERKTVSVRMAAEDIERLDALAAVLSTPWRKGRRSDAARAAALVGLRVYETQGKPLSSSSGDRT